MTRSLMSRGIRANEELEKEKYLREDGQVFQTIYATVWMYLSFSMAVFRLMP